MATGERRGGHLSAGRATPTLPARRAHRTRTALLRGARVDCLATAYISVFLGDFIVPLMYRLDLTATEAWQRFIPLLKLHFRPLVLYGLFRLVLGMAAGMAVLLLMIVTCCIAACLAAIPYVGAVLLLPVTVFFRAYSLEYLAQFGPAYRMDSE